MLIHREALNEGERVARQGGVIIILQKRAVSLSKNYKKLPILCGPMTLFRYIYNILYVYNIIIYINLLWKYPPKSIKAICKILFIIQ